MVQLDGRQNVVFFLLQSRFLTLCSGIGPSYSTKAARSGIRIHDIFDKKSFDDKVNFLYNGYKKRFGDLLKYDVQEELARFDKYRDELAPYVIDQVPFMADAQETGKKILIEGANGTYCPCSLCAFHDTDLNSSHARRRLGNIPICHQLQHM